MKYEYDRAINLVFIDDLNKEHGSYTMVYMRTCVGVYLVPQQLCA